MSLPTIAYAAKSSPDPRADDRTSVAQQLSAIEEAIAAADAADGSRRFVAAGPFHEENASGYHGNRGPELEAAMSAAVQAAEEHGAAELWVWHSNRLGRGSGRKDEARSVLEVFIAMRRAGVTLRSVTDDAYIQDDAMVGMASKMAHKYGEDLSRNVTRGKQRQFDQGQWLGGPVPDGYRVRHVRDQRGQRVARREIGFDHDREPIIRAMIAHALDGRAPAAIARELNAAGWRTSRDRPWTRRSVQNILSNEFYAGAVVRFRSRYVYRGKRRIEQPPQEVNWGPHHVAYLTREQWESIQASWKARDRSASGRPKGGRPTARYALSRLATCASCGESMYAVTSPYRRRDGTHKRTYVCANVKASTGLCDAPPVDAEAVDASVLEMLPRFTFDFEQWAARISDDQAAERAKGEQARDDALEELDRISQLVQKVQHDYLRQLEDGDERAAKIAAQAMDAVEQRRERQEKALAEAQEALEGIPAETPHDAMLDVLSALRATVAGRVSEALPDGMQRVNERLREMFHAFRLGTSDEGVAIEAVLTADFAQQLVGAHITGELVERPDGEPFFNVERIARPSETLIGSHE